jgi:hypothetical protein
MFAGTPQCEAAPTTNMVGIVLHVRFGSKLYRLMAYRRVYFNFLGDLGKDTVILTRSRAGAQRRSCGGEESPSQPGGDASLRSTPPRAVALRSA